MSTPPVPPTPSDPNSNEPSQDAAEARGAQPRYGQDAPQYGQNTPPAPQYGQNTPPAPQYGQNTPRYGQGAPQQPQYGQNAPQYGQQSSAPSPFGQAQSGKSPYGQSPYGQPPYGYPSEQPQGGTGAGAPQLVNTSFWMILGAGVLSVLSVLLAIPTLDDPAIRNSFEEQLRGSGQNVAFDDVKGFLIGTMVVFALIGAGLYALVAFNVRKGRNWARILGTVLAALSVFSIFPLGLNTLVGLVGIAAIVMLYMPASASYFQKPQPFANPYSQPGGPFGR
ncbi:hypothetical protein B1A87_000265 [Arthrobacter sp. KBS0703]|uniref:hypothetical protein n=1 Tax=Arthrobacter sp. KBS0703 TaxID=1955698 RepID=UPI00098F397B|nr:hypothetical protein [Arthrobacter sp. KBS0703]TSE14601.1 hypothetical protein B1A87_000265 [Arthrobacter sp. KBS0703]